MAAYRESLICGSQRPGKPEDLPPELIIIIVELQKLPVNFGKWIKTKFWMLTRKE